MSGPSREDDESAAASVEAWRPRWLIALHEGTYGITRFVFLRFLGLIYVVAFAVAFNQLVPLVGHAGLLPAEQFLAQREGSAREAKPSCAFRRSSGSVSRTPRSSASSPSGGLLLSLVVLGGFANAVVLFVLWLFYLSIVQAGQLFWGYGWESLLLETGFLAIFLAPPLDPRPFPKNESPPRVTSSGCSGWLAFRLMLGAGLIKLRGDACWRDLTCLVDPLRDAALAEPAELAYLHQLPLFVQRASVLFNHYAELVAPFLLFLPRRFRLVGALSIIAFQAAAHRERQSVVAQLAHHHHRARAASTIAPGCASARRAGARSSNLLAVEHPMSKLRRRAVIDLRRRSSACSA